MKLQILSIILLIVAICATGNGQLLPNGPAAGAPPSFCEIQLVILQSEANKINTPDQDLQLRKDAVLTNAANGCSDCDGLVIWLNKVCLVVNLRTGLNQLSQIKTEADARAATATTTLIPAQ